MPLIQLICTLIFWVFAQAPGAVAQDLEADRALFQRALSELRTGPGPRYEALRRRLEDYPLAPYLDYEVLKNELHDLQPERARVFLAETEGSPLHNRFLAAYLEHKGRDRRWRELLGVLDEAPRDERLQCYYYRAKRSAGHYAEAWRGAAALWNTGRSQDDACDPLFDEWIRQTGGPDDALVWSRALKAFDARSPHLIAYVRRFASDTLQPLLGELLAVYRQPDRLERDAHQPSVLHAQLMTVGIRRLARVNPGKGYRALLNAVPVQPFTDLEREAMEATIVRHSLFTQSAPPEEWQLETLERLRDDELTEIYLRNQVAEGHWSTLLRAVAWLSNDRWNSDQWRYWRARALEASGSAVEAQAVYGELAGERSYHGFLAADRLGLPYVLNGATEAPGAPPNEPAVARVSELLALNRSNDARLEWRYLLDRHAPEGQVALAQLALQRGWPFFAIDAANTARAWDRIELRFPMAFAQLFEETARQLDLDPAELMAIARRESAMYPRARSTVGARGLMQVMPGTARQVARQEGLTYRRSALYDADYNVAIGSRYYRQLLDRFDGHRPKALAGYNAGPHRVDRWSDTDLPVDRWIDSLPFRETREYVQAVLAYAVIYRQREGNMSPMLNADEWQLKKPRENV